MTNGEHDFEQLAATERQAFGELLRGLTEAEWGTPSLCEGWTVREVAAHLVENATASGNRMLVGLIGAGFSPERQSRRGIARHASQTPEQLAALVAAPELHGLQAKQPHLALSESFIHQQDVRRPLNKPRQYPEPTLLAMLDITVSKLLGTSSTARARGLEITATDVAWTHGDGSGEPLNGPAEALIMALNGRAQALAELSGEGLEGMAERLQRVHAKKSR